MPVRLTEMESNAVDLTATSMLQSVEPSVVVDVVTV